MRLCVERFYARSGNPWLPRAAGILVLIVVVLHQASAFAQCALCRGALSSADGSGVGSGLAGGILWSTIVLTAAPLAVIAIIGTLLYRAYRRNVRERPSAAAGHGPVGDAALQPQEA